MDRRFEKINEGSVKTAVPIDLATGIEEKLSCTGKGTDNETIDEVLRSDICMPSKIRDIVVIGMDIVVRIRVCGITVEINVPLLKSSSIPEMLVKKVLSTADDRGFSCPRFPIFA